MSQFDESKIRRDDEGKFASKGPAAEASGVQLTDPLRDGVIEDTHYQVNRDELRQEKIVQDMTDEIVAGNKGDLAASIKMIDEGGFGMMSGALNEYHRRGGENAGSIGAVSTAIRQELVDRYQAQQAPAEPEPNEPDSSDNEGAELEDMYETSRPRRSKKEPEPAPSRNPDPYGEDRLSPKPEVNLTETRRGVHTVSDTVVEDMGVDERGFHRTMMHIGGDAALKSRNLASIDMMRDSDGEAVDNKVHELCRNGSPMTVLVASQHDGTVSCYEGRGMLQRDGSPFLMMKGSKSRGWAMSNFRVGAVEKGYGRQQALADHWAESTSRHIPATEPIENFDDVPEAIDNDGYAEPRDQVAAVYLLNHRTPWNSESSAGCMFMATDRQAGAGGERGDIINGYFWAPQGRNTGLTSEHGSFYSSDLRSNAAKISDYEPDSMSFNDCWQGMPEDAGEGYRRVVGRSYYAD